MSTQQQQQSNLEFGESFGIEAFKKKTNSSLIQVLENGNGPWFLTDYGIQGMVTTKIDVKQANPEDLQVVRVTKENGEQDWLLCKRNRSNEVARF